MDLGIVFTSVSHYSQRFRSGSLLSLTYALVCFKLVFFRTRVRESPAHCHLHLRRRNVFACTLTFLGPERAYCRRQLRSGPRAPKEALWLHFSSNFSSVLVPFHDLFANVSFLLKTHGAHTGAWFSRVKPLKIHPFGDPFSAPFSTPFPNTLRDLPLEPFMLI